MMQCKPPGTRWYNNLNLAGKRPVRMKSPITRIQYLWKVPGFRSVGHILLMVISSESASVNLRVA